MKISGGKRYAPYLYVLPGVLLLSVITLYPFLHAIYLGFTDYNPLFKEQNLIGLDNFKEILESPLFFTAFQNNVVWTVGIVVMQFSIGLAAALLLNQMFPGRTICRGLILLPWVVPNVVAGVLWESIYNPTLGVLSYILVRLGITSHRIVWLGSDYVLFSLMLILTWRMIPFMVVMLLAGLGAIPEELYEAATIDGSNWFQSLIRITLPLLKPVISISLLLSFIWVFKHFDIVYSLTGGGPVDASMLLSVLTYREAFRHYRFGYSAALGMIMLVIFIAPVYFYVKQTLGEKRM